MFYGNNRSKLDDLKFSSWLVSEKYLLKFPRAVYRFYDTRSTKILQVSVRFQNYLLFHNTSQWEIFKWIFFGEIITLYVFAVISYKYLVAERVEMSDIKFIF